MRLNLSLKIESIWDRTRHQEEVSSIGTVWSIALLTYYIHDIDFLPLMMLSWVHMIVHRLKTKYALIFVLLAIFLTSSMQDRSYMATITWAYFILVIRFPKRQPSELFSFAILITKTFISRVTFASGNPLSTLESITIWIFITLLIRYDWLMLLISLVSAPALESLLTFNIISGSSPWSWSIIKYKMVYASIILFPTITMVLLLLYCARYTRIDGITLQSISILILTCYVLFIGEEWGIVVISPIMIFESFRAIGFFDSLRNLHFFGELIQVFEGSARGNYFKVVDEEDKDIKDEDLEQSEMDATIPLEKDKLNSSGSVGTHKERNRVVFSNTRSQSIIRIPNPLKITQSVKNQQYQIKTHRNHKKMITPQTPIRRRSTVHLPFSHLNGCLLVDRTDTCINQLELKTAMTIFWPIYDYFILRSGTMNTPDSMQTSSSPQSSPSSLHNNLFPIVITGIAHPMSSIVGASFGRIRNMNRTYLEDSLTFFLVTLHFASAYLPEKGEYSNYLFSFGLMVMRMLDRRQLSSAICMSIVSYHYSFRY